MNLNKTLSSKTKPHIELSLLDSLIERARLHFPPAREKTIFDIGYNGHLENPLSDILSFFLDPRECHGLGTLFLDSIVACCADSKSSHNFDLFKLNTTLAADVKREQNTSDGKRIDVLVITPEWILVIENKVFHAQINPFKSYERHVRQNYPGRNVLYAILSPRGKSEAEGWIGISFMCYASKLKDRLETTTTRRLLTKWDMIARELLLHLENFERIRIMDNKQAEFVRRNWDDINQIEKLKSDYFIYLEHTIKEALIGTYQGQDFQLRKISEGIMVTSSSRWPKTEGQIFLSVSNLEMQINVFRPSLPQQALLDKLIPLPIRKWGDFNAGWGSLKTASYKDKSLDCALKGLCELCVILNQVEDE